MKADRVFNYWKREKLTVSCIVVFGLSFNILAVLAPVWQGKMIDAIATGKPLDAVLWTVASFLALILLIQTLRYFKRFFIRVFANRTIVAMRRTIYRNIMDKSVPELEKENTGNLMTRAIGDVGLCVEGMRKFTTELFDTGVLLATYFVSLLLYDVPLSLAACFFIPVAMFLAQKLKGVIFRYTTEWRKKNSELADMTYSSVDNAMLYRARGLEGAYAERYDAELSDLQGKAVKANILENTMQPVYNAIAMAGVLLVIYFGGSKVVNGAWTLGQFSAYLSIFAATAFKASKASKLFNSVQKSQVSWKRIKPYLGSDIVEDEKKMPDQGKSETAGESAQAQVSPREQGPAALEVSGLSLRFEGAKDYAVRNVSFTARAGEIIGITGPVACGKSALAAAIAGIYPYEGSVRVNGRELRELGARERSDLVSWMGHGSDLLSDTIQENVSLGIADDGENAASGGHSDDIFAALRDVQFSDDLASMPAGLQTRVGNAGVRLSGGQQARIALARALVGKRPVIILDDPLSAVDVKTEGRIVESLRIRYRDSVILLVSHRLSVFPDVDRIVFLRADGPAEYGSHGELLSRSRLYAEIFSLQNAGCGEDA
jgi:ABC-type multidrug transport system fused ATPase/permease subunit